MPLSFTRRVNRTLGVDNSGDIVDAAHINELQVALEGITTGAAQIPLPGIEGALGAYGPLNDALADILAMQPSVARADGLPGADDVLAMISAALGTLPAVPDLFAHWDATQIVATDGSRVSSWLDEVSSIDAAQATSGNQPLYVVNGIGGKPSVYFENSRDDALVTGAVAPASDHPTIFLVASMTAPVTGARYAFGTDGHAKNLYFAAPLYWGMQGGTVVNGTTVIDGGEQIVSAQFNDADSFIRANGRQVDGDVGTQTTNPTQFSIGHRTALTAGQGSEGYIGEVLYYDRALTDDEIAVIERYLSVKWGIPVSQQYVWHVDSLNGTALGDGRTVARAMNSLWSAVNDIRQQPPAQASIVVFAPEDTPLRETTDFFTIDTGTTIRMTSRTPGQPWYVYGSQQFTSGWTDAGGGVYSRSLSLTDVAPICWVPTLLDGDGQPTRITTKNTATPTTPDEEEYGYDSGTYYVHLPDDASANSHTIEVVTVINLALVTDNSTLVIQDGVWRGSQGTVVRAGDSSGAVTGAGYVHAIDSTAEYAGDSCWGTSQYVTGMRCVRCYARYATNDGFNHHCHDGDTSPLMELIDCDSSYNKDEGVSPHESTRLIITRGRFHHNAQGGLTAAGSSSVQAFAAEFDNNRMHDSTVSPPSTDIGGITLLETASLSARELYVHDHPGPGIEVYATATFTDLGLNRSGTAYDNALPDEGI
jgi:hypothetical protein